MDKLKLTLLQTTLAWEAPEQNRNHIARLMKKIRKGATDIIILPEMFSTGFTMNAVQMAETMKGESVSWLRENAVAKNAVVCGSLIIKEKEKYFNRLVWAKPDGKVVYYDKRHLFRMAAEHKTYSQGNKKLIVNFKGWKICPLVCYDLRFPVWSRNDGKIDLMIYIANWPERRSYAWKQLLIARSIENQCFVAGLNRVGNDGKNIPYSGDSVVLDPMGMPVVPFVQNKERIINITLLKSQLDKLRKAFPVMLDRDRFRII